MSIIVPRRSLLLGGTAQPALDCSVLAELTDKTIILGVLDLDDPEVETPDTALPWAS